MNAKAIRQKQMHKNEPKLPNNKKKEMYKIRETRRQVPYTWMEISRSSLVIIRILEKKKCC